MMEYMNKKLGENIETRTLTRTLCCLSPRVATLKAALFAQASKLVCEVVKQKCIADHLRRALINYYNKVVIIQRTVRHDAKTSKEALALNKTHWDVTLSLLCEDERKYAEKQWIVAKCPI